MATAAELRRLNYAVPLTVADDTEIYAPEVFSHGPQPPEFYSHVDKSSDPKPPTAGELRELGYVVPLDVADDASSATFDYATGGPAEPGTYHYVDDIPPTPYPYPKPELPATEESAEPEVKPPTARELRRRRREEMEQIVRSRRT